MACNGDVGSLVCNDNGDGRQWCLQVSAAHNLSAGAMAGNRCDVGLMTERVIQRNLDFFYINKTYAYHIGDKNEKLHILLAWLDIFNQDPTISGNFVKYCSLYMACAGHMTFFFLNPKS